MFVIEVGLMTPDISRRNAFLGFSFSEWLKFLQAYHNAELFEFYLMLKWLCVCFRLMLLRQVWKFISLLFCCCSFLVCYELHLKL
jgi:hypothetical protein